MDRFLKSLSRFDEVEAEGGVEFGLGFGFDDFFVDAQGCGRPPVAAEFTGAVQQHVYVRLAPSGINEGADKVLLGGEVDEEFAFAEFQAQFKFGIARALCEAVAELGIAPCGLLFGCFDVAIEEIEEFVPFWNGDESNYLAKSAFAADFTSDGDTVAVGLNPSDDLFAVLLGFGEGQRIHAEILGWNVILVK